MKKPANNTKVGTVPEWGRMPTRTLIDLTGLTERRLRALASDGKIPEATAGIWDGREVIRRLVAFRLAKFSDESGDVSMAEAKRQREQHKARREKILADIAEDKAVPVEHAIRLVTKAASQVRTRLLAIPAKAAALLEAKDVTEREILLRQEVDDALGELNKIKLEQRK